MLSQTVAIQPPESEDIREEALSWPERANAVRIVDNASYVNATELLKGIKALRRRIGEVFDPHVTRAHEAHKALVREKKDAEAPLTEAEGLIKRALVQYTDKQERQRREDEQRLRDEARRREEQRRLEEAAALEQQAVESGNVALGREAEALLEAPVHTPAVQVAPTTPKVSGISYRETYRAQLVNLMALVTHVATHPEHANLLTLNQPAANQLARSLKTNLRVPGLEVVVQTVPAAGSR